MLKLKPEDLDRKSISRTNRFLLVHPEVNLDEVSKVDAGAGPLETWLRTILSAAQRNVVERRTTSKVMGEKSSLEKALRNDSEDTLNIRARLESIDNTLSKINDLEKEMKTKPMRVSRGPSIEILQEERGKSEEHSRLEYDEGDSSTFTQSFNYDKPRQTVCVIDYGSVDTEIVQPQRPRTRRKKKKHRMGNLHRNN